LIWRAHVRDVYLWYASPWKRGVFPEDRYRRKTGDRHAFPPKPHREAVTSSVACGDTSSIKEDEGDYRCGLA
jgi:hypothetical protein